MGGGDEGSSTSQGRDVRLRQRSMIHRGTGFCALLVFTPLVLSAEPQWLTDARAREGQLGEPRDIQSSDGWFSAKLPVAVIGKIEKVQGSYTVEFSVGSANTASCEVFPDAVDPAAFLKTAAEKTFSDVIEKAQGKVDRRALEAIDSGQFGVTPYLGLSWLYRVNVGKAPLLGALKQYTAVKQGHGIYCAHIDVGYVRTFQSVVKALVESSIFHDKEPVAAPFYYETSVAQLKGMKIGYSTVTLERDADGDVKTIERTAVIIPVTPDTASYIDTLHLEWTHADGAMINALLVVSLNDSLDSNLTLDAKQGRWHVTGEFKGKKIDQLIDAAGPPGTWLSRALQRRALLNAEPSASQEAPSSAWVSADPTHFTESRTTLLGKTPEGGQASLRESVGGLVADVTVDAATGQELKALVPIGNQTITMERIGTQGSYWR